MSEIELKLFTEELDKSYIPMSIALRSIRLPTYTWSICNKIEFILKELGYDVLTEGRANSHKRFIEKGYPGYRSYDWHSRGLLVHYHSGPSEVILSIFSTEKRKNEALKIAKEIENRITEDANKYLQGLNDEKFTEEAKRKIPTLQ